jgi:hypothetical protein
MMEITAHYFAGAPGVDVNKMLKEARDRQKNGEGSIVHMHRQNESCNDMCKEFS